MNQEPKTYSRKIKFHFLVYGAYVFIIASMILLICVNPGSSSYMQSNPPVVYVNIFESSMEIVAPTHEEAPELKNIEEERITAMVFEGNRAAAYILALTNFKNACQSRNEHPIEKPETDSDAEDDWHSLNVRGLMFVMISASLDFSSAYYLLSLFYLELKSASLSNDCLSKIYYICWAKKNNLTNAILKTKEYVIHNYGQKIWDEIDSISSKKLKKATLNNQELAQAADKSIFVSALLNNSKNILDEDETFDDGFWYNILTI